jgi:RNA polymerase sigma factor (sigma-70 family)
MSLEEQASGKKQKLNQNEGDFDHASLWQKFEHSFGDILVPESASGISLLTFIRRGLKQFHLDSFYSVRDVLGEAYIRAYRLIHDEQVDILNPPAWVKKTAFNIIREWSRRERRFEPLETEVADELVHPPVDPSALSTDIIILNRAWQELDPDERRLLQLKIVEELPWREISNLYALEGKPISESALRKQKERALKHLRKVYHSLRPLEDIKEQGISEK